MKEINRALVRQQMFFGVEKAGIILLFLVVGFAGGSGMFAKGPIYGVGCALVCGFPAFFALRRMAKYDPQLLMVAVRSMRYRQSLFPGRGRSKALVRLHVSNFDSQR